MTDKQQFRTIVSTWALFSQQLLGLTLFYTYASVFFSAAGFDDPFAITCITNGIQLVVIVLVAISVDRIGRRNICCGGLTTMLVGITLIGIVGVLPNRGKAANSLLVFFCCIYMVGLQCSGSTGWAYVGEISSQRLRPYTAGFAAALSCVMGVIMNGGSKFIEIVADVSSRSLHAHCQRVELGSQDCLLLPRPRCSLRHRLVVPHPRDRQAHRPRARRAV